MPEKPVDTEPVMASKQFLNPPQSRFQNKPQTSQLLQPQVSRFVHANQSPQNTTTITTTAEDAATDSTKDSTKDATEALSNENHDKCFDDFDAADEVKIPPPVTQIEPASTHSRHHGMLSPSYNIVDIQRQRGLISDNIEFDYTSRHPLTQTVSDGFLTFLQTSLGLDMKTHEDTVNEKKKLNEKRNNLKIRLSLNDTKLTETHRQAHTLLVSGCPLSSLKAAGAHAEL